MHLSYYLVLSQCRLFTDEIDVIGRNIKQVKETFVAKKVSLNVNVYRLPSLPSQELYERVVTTSK